MSGNSRYGVVTTGAGGGGAGAEAFAISEGTHGNVDGAGQTRGDIENHQANSASVCGRHQGNVIGNADSLPGSETRQQKLFSSGPSR